MVFSCLFSNGENNYCFSLLTEFAFRTVKYLDQGLAVRTELARSVCKDPSLNILLCVKQTRLINNLLYDTVNICQESTENARNLTTIFQKFG